MTIVDANVLLYAVNSADPNHRPARRWLEAALNGPDAVAFAWITILAFIRLATSARVFPSPLAVGEAAELVAGWLSQPTAVVVAPTTRHLAILRGLLGPTGSAGNLVSDAHLAALAVEYGAAVASFDRDFLRFPGVQLTVPGRP